MDTLGLAMNQIGDVSAKAIAEALVSSGSMATLWITNNRFGDAAKQSMRDAFQGRQGFDLQV